MILVAQDAQQSIALRYLKFSVQVTKWIHLTDRNSHVVSQEEKEEKYQRIRLQLCTAASISHSDILYKSGHNKTDALSPDQFFEEK